MIDNTLHKIKINYISGEKQLTKPIDCDTNHRL